MTTANDTIDFARLEGYLKVLSHANRLELLSLLRQPRTLDEVTMTPTASQAEGNPHRAITRQAVQSHLDRLAEVGLVRVAPTRRVGKRAVHEYFLDQTRLFAIVEEMRKLGRLRSRVALDPFATMDLESNARASPDEDCLRVVIVHGIDEGRTFPLRHADRRSPRGWIVGRSADAHVMLDYDPYVSLENCEILEDGAGFRLLDLRTAKNGTHLNWRRLPVGGETALRNGDVIGVGSSLLVFRAP